MTLRFYVQSVVKRAEGVALIDSGATENFMNLDYARWLKLPIKELKQHCPLFNVELWMAQKIKAEHYTTIQTYNLGWECKP